jgi:sec-independent protein translocase protein TatA
VKRITVFYFYLCRQLLLQICLGINYYIMGRFGVTEMLVILVVVLLLFGGKKIPELLKGLGTGIKEFKNAAKEDQPADKKEEEEKKE